MSELRGDEPLPFPEEQPPSPHRRLVPGLTERHVFYLDAGKHQKPSLGDINQLLQASVACAIKGLPLKWLHVPLAHETKPGQGGVEIVLRGFAE